MFEHPYAHPIIPDGKNCLLFIKRFLSADPVKKSPLPSSSIGVHEWVTLSENKIGDLTQRSNAALRGAGCS